ncbi:hypothetical protein CesoFtcFv8_021924 [Champsocephalus esox]|uniref:Uncharacterized protein n=1 Tax=Champsocephalus esox TaxID=159716 RepID=A0AAN8GJ60_9TELE|nr:hypothetical protein CesoFtcFv8_021924 [Champsocephalus esox]
MDRRSYSNNRCDTRADDHENAVEESLNKIHWRNGKIYGLADFRNACDCEKMTFAHRMHKENDMGKSLEEDAWKKKFEREDLALKQSREKRELEEKFSKMEMKLKEMEKNDLAEKHLSSENVVKQLVDQLKQQEETFFKNKPQSLETEPTKLEIKLKRVMNKNIRLAKKNKSLETEVKVLKDDRQEQEERVNKDLADRHQSWETELMQEMMMKKTDLTRRNKTLETEVQEFKDQRREQKEKENLAQEQLSWEAKERMVEDEHQVLQDVFFKRVTEEKVIPLQKMQSRKPQKDRARGAKMEEAEASINATEETENMEVTENYGEGVWSWTHQKCDSDIEWEEA